MSSANNSSMKTNIPINKEIQAWVPGIEFTLPAVSEKHKRLYMAKNPSCIYYPYRWLYLKGRHKKGREFPVVIAEKHFIDQGYKVWVSGQSKIGKKAFNLLNFPSARKERDQSYLKMIEVFGEKKIDKFIFFVEKKKKKYGLRRNGGDPDLFVQNILNPSDRFFVEVKAEDFTGRRRYRDKLTNQQHLVFPLIEKYLKCRVRIAKVQIVPETTILRGEKETPSGWVTASADFSGAHRFTPHRSEHQR
jgi:hypothetical protein